MKTQRPLMIAVVIGILALFRLIPHAPNFTPVLAMALFAGLYFRNIRFALLAPLVVMLLGDLFLGFHLTMPFVYGSLLLIALLNRGGLGSSPWSSVAFGAPLSAAVFFIITNFGVWVSQGMYPMTLAGLLDCYAMALPFFRNTLLSTVIYSFSAVAVWELIAMKWTQLAEKRA